MPTQKERAATVDPVEAAKILGLRPQTLAVWRCQRRYLPFIRSGRRIRYRVSDLETFLEARTVQPEAND